jgi:hypothetical protein
VFGARPEHVVIDEEVGVAKGLDRLGIIFDY